MKTISMNKAMDTVKYAENCTREERLKLQNERLKELVNYARENSLYIREKYRNLPDDFELKDIPPSSKTEIMEHYEDWVIIEPIDENGELITSEDKWSSGILITDLSNYIQPVIRYRLDDSVKIHTDCTCGNKLPYLDIHGREGGLIEFAGKSIKMISLGFLLEDRLGTFNIQIIKRSDRIMEIRSMIPVSEGRENYLKRVVEMVKEYLENEGFTDFEVSMSQSDPIRNERGGKMPGFVEVNE